MDKLNKGTSILYYWTIRYLLIISIGLLITTAATFWWIQQEAMENRMQTTALLAQEFADLSVKDGSINISPRLGDLFENRKQFFKLNTDMCVIIMDQSGQMLFSSPPMSKERMRMELNESLSNARSREYRAATAPISGPEGMLGKVFVLQSVRSLKHIPRNEVLFFGLLQVFLIILSWLTIYLLSRKLAKPVQTVAAAAVQISGGEYNIKLQKGAKEREINELIVSFQDMAGKLQQFEESRAFMLAGVSHELKTPVTSFKGLIHAVREGVVENDEAEEFLDIALLEADKLQRMVEDLLDYNAMTAGIVPIRHNRIAASPLLSEVVYQWKLTQAEEVCEPMLILPTQSLYLLGDPLRIQQIIVNLLNNSVQAGETGRKLQLTLELKEQPEGTAKIIVTDNGTGIAPDMQSQVFEAFVRSREKNSIVRGLGLGLTFSRLLAESMGGSLDLLESSEQGSTFLLELPLQR
ncbi:ATP-binding protein [Paenibacillus sp. NPDC057934]|uniref:ATP-binding protein n=1 Tax=Paenibacillus sp. NPDC057934 TaxID=3346282 RepID=UPI0036DD8FDF